MLHCACAIDWAVCISLIYTYRNLYLHIDVGEDSPVPCVKALGVVSKEGKNVLLKRHFPIPTSSVTEMEMLL